MSRKRILIVALYAAFLGPCIGGIWWFVRAITICNTGSPELAREWAAILDGLPDPEVAQQANGRIWGKRFPNEEWLFGLAQDSHGAPRIGGTVVIKDSRGGMRAFAGHVCGPHYVQYTIERVGTLDEFYEQLQQLRFTEVTWLNE